MYFELTAPSRTAFRRAVWDANIMGLDPEECSEPLTFNIGTGSIEKVSNLREKYGLTEVYVAEFEPHHPYKKE